MEKRGFLQVRITHELERELGALAQQTHEGNVSALVRDVLCDHVGNPEVSPGTIRLPYSLLGLMVEKAKAAGLPLEEFIRYTLIKNLVNDKVEGG